MEKIDGVLVFSLVLIVAGLFLFVVPVLPKGSPWQSDNPSNGTPDGTQKESSLKVLSAGWSLSGVSFRIENAGKETATLTGIYVKTEWGDAFLYAGPLSIPSGTTAEVSAYMTWTGGETYTFRFVSGGGVSFEKAFTAPAGGGG